MELQPRQKRGFFLVGAGTAEIATLSFCNRRGRRGYKQTYPCVITMTDVKIYKPTKTAMQSGTARTKDWVLEFLPTSAKFVDDLMGWVGQSDTTQQMKLFFDSEEEAVAYAQSKNYRIHAFKPKQKILKPKAYADNFRFDKVK